MTTTTRLTLDPLDIRIYSLGSPAVFTNPPNSTACPHTLTAFRHALFPCHFFCLCLIFSGGRRRDVDKSLTVVGICWELKHLCRGDSLLPLSLTRTDSLQNGYVDVVAYAKGHSGRYQRCCNTR